MKSSEKESSTSKPTSLSEELKSQTAKWVLTTYKVFLTVLHVTLAIIFVTVGDALAVFIISWALGDPASQSVLARKFLDGIKILSVLGVSVSYTIYLVYSLFQDVKHVFKMVQEDSKEERKK
jgi:hypothetical protein